MKSNLLRKSRNLFSSINSFQTIEMLADIFTKQPKRKVVVIGSGNWGSVAARIIAQNVKRYPEQFDPTVNIWVFQEQITVNEKKYTLTDYINDKKENVKYLPGINLGDNIVAIPDLHTAITGCSILVFVTPHQFITKIVKDMKGRIDKSSIGVSLIKGMEFSTDDVSLISSYITKELEIECAVLMGANIAPSVAKEEFSEATVGCRSLDHGYLIHKLFNTDYFSVNFVTDVEGVELCGTLKNIVALGAGFVDGLDLGHNTKAAIVRVGLIEMKKICQLLFPEVRDDTFFESAGVADLITTCYGGRNRKCAEAYARSGGARSFEEIEAELLQGQKLQGVLTSQEVQKVLEKNGWEREFPLFTTINLICQKQLPPKEIVNFGRIKQRTPSTS